MKCRFVYLFLIVGIPAISFANIPIISEKSPYDSPVPLVHAPGVKEPKFNVGYFDLYSRGTLREMELPSFESQRSALGYTPGKTFIVPESLKPRVAFWKKIYTEYTSQQSVLHDSENLDIIYTVIDLSRFMGDSSLSYRKQSRLIDNYITSEKDKIEKTLTELHTLSEDVNRFPNNLNETQFEIYRKFDKIKDKNKFLQARSQIRAQAGQRDHVVRGFLFGGRYFKEMMQIFVKRGLPQELTRLPMVESAFNLNARSKVGASGVWQFMRATGKRYLKINHLIDERNDPIKATWAAAELLRSNFEALGSWELAVTAYNHGASGVRKAANRLGSRDISALIEGDSFGFASANFYSEFLAILELEREFRNHFGKLMVDNPINYEEVPIRYEITFSELANCYRLHKAELATLNSALTDLVLSGRNYVPRGYYLKVPDTHSRNCRTLLSSRKQPKTIRVSMREAKQNRRRN